MVTDNDLQRQASTGDDTEDYRRVFRKQVFQLLKWGYDRLNASEYQAAEEEDITGEFAKEINFMLEDRTLPKWVSHFYVHEEYRVNVKGRKGKRRKRLDIVFIRTQYGVRPHFPFEAKRLSAGTHPIGKYLGVEGLGQFLTGDYGQEVSEGGMLGYVQSHTSDYWAQKAIEKIINAPQEYQIFKKGCWINEEILEGLSACYRSTHHRLLGKSPIAIFHCFLIFLGVPHNKSVLKAFHDNDLKIGTQYRI
ncbi:MAG: hypothetical protein ISS65_06975 [Desulfobacterales bacterium]|uniref:Uncharacterized protein n=1 Tax=Candidatus Desulfatibia profunda TaxID=2841695 RepID=A0A8J6TGT9_9BACT|nr:hypothetical protein [Candidatus Desulfatibia profunda]MBL7179938.1 hypothetical protein [Desulfobacterales bacterium]